MKLTSKKTKLLFRKTRGGIKNLGAEIKNEGGYDLEKNINEEIIINYVEQAAKGDDIAFERLLAIYDESFKRKVKLYFLKGGDSQDLLQSMRFGLAKAVRLYEKSKGSFNYFLSICVKSELFDTIKLYNSKKQVMLNGCSDIDSDPVSDIAGGSADEIFDSELENWALSLTKEKYGELDREIFALYLADYSYDEIGKKVGLSSKQVDNRLMKIKKFLEKNLPKVI